MPKFLDLTGEPFFRLTVIALVRRATRKHPGTIWLCQCECGAQREVYSSNLTGKKTKSCGCWNKEFIRPTQTHAMSHTTEYRIWAGMVSRCTLPQFPDYHGRGITICERWRTSFEAFFHDMGPRPSLKHQIDRSDNNGPYDPSNCRWATRIEQSNNKRSNRLLTWNDKTLTAAEWSRETGIPAYLILERITRRRKKWTIEQALSTPPRPIKKSR